MFKICSKFRHFTRLHLFTLYSSAPKWLKKGETKYCSLNLRLATKIRSSQFSSSRVLYSLKLSSLAVTFGRKVVIPEWWSCCLRIYNTFVCAQWHIHSWVCLISSLNTINFWTWREVGSRWKEALDAGRFLSPWPCVARQLLTPWASCQEKHKKGNNPRWKDFGIIATYSESCVFQTGLLKVQ